MKIIFLTLAPLSSNAGHLARMKLGLNDFAKLNQVAILCLNKVPDDQFTIKSYPHISFLNKPILFKNWDVSNIQEVVDYISGVVDDQKPDIVLLQMEVWDLIERELSVALKSKTIFAVMFHAMPFLIAPLEPSGDFENDVLQYVKTDIPEYRKEYIKAHYLEAKDVLKDIVVIANNNTSFFYLKKYFKDITTWILPSSIVTNRKNKISNKNFRYDFAYMARMEKGKGVEYLSEILFKVYNLMGRKVKVVILGRADDEFSKRALGDILNESKTSNFFEIEYVGWAGDTLKEELLGNTSVFLYPSHYDNYPTVLNEALSFGLPCVTWDVPFYKLNYLNTSAVKPIKLYDFDSFARMAFDCLCNRESLSFEALRFVNDFPTDDRVVEMDIETFTKILIDKHA